MYSGEDGGVGSAIFLCVVPLAILCFVVADVLCFVEEGHFHVDAFMIFFIDFYCFCGYFHDFAEQAVSVMFFFFHDSFDVPVCGSKYYLLMLLRSFPLSCANCVLAY